MSINSLLRKNKKLMLVIGIVLVIFISILVIIVFNNSNLPDSKRFKKEYEKLNGEISRDGRNYPEVNIPSDNIIKYINIDEVLTMLNSNYDFVIYFGEPSCIYCRNAVQVLVDTSEKTELDVIYYLNADESDASYNELISVLGEELTVEGDSTRNLYLPLVIFVVDGEIISYNKGTLFSQEDPYKKLDNSQIEGLSEIYKLGIDTVVASKKLKNQL